MRTPDDQLTDEETELFIYIIENYAKKERPLEFYEPNNKATEFHKSTAMYRILHGANRSGKTYSGAAEAAYFATCTHPYKDILPNEGWVVSETYKVQEEASQKTVMSLLPPNQIKKIVNIKGGVMESITIDVVKKGRKIGESKIGFKSSDSGVRNFAGAAKRWIWFDEEPPRDVYNECITRIGAGQDLSIWFTMTPIFQQRGSSHRGGMSWVYRDLYQKKDGKRIAAFGMSVEDNQHLSKEQIEEQKLKYTGVEYDIRIKGEFKLLAGNSVFDSEKLDKRKKELGKYAQGYLSEGKFVDKPNGSLKIYVPPALNRRYFIGADIGLGVGGDPSCAVVLDDNMVQVAELHGQIPPDRMGTMLKALGDYYKNAWIGIEANSFGIACINAIKHEYGKLYFSYKVDGRSDVRTKRVGWWTDTKTKPLMVGEYAKAIRQGAIEINSDELIDEMATYVLGDDGSTNAEIGCHDDRVIAAMIALQVRKKHLVTSSDIKTEDFVPSNNTTGY